MALRRITAPTTLAVTLADVVAQVKLNVGDDDALITSMLWSAMFLAEKETGRALMTQTWELTLDAFPDAIELTRVPVQSIASFTYVDKNGATQNLTGSTYVLDTADGYGTAYLVPAYATSWPTTRDQINAVKLQYVAGYADAASVPEPIKQWMRAMVAAMYKDREAYSDAKSYKLEYLDGLLDEFRIYKL